MKNTSKGEKIFRIINYIFLTIFGMATLFPFLNIIAKSFSGNTAIMSGSVGIIPKDFQLEAYKDVLGQAQFWSSFKISVFVTVGGTVMAMLITVCTAYPLSKRGFKGRKLLLLVFVFTMLFNGGMVPNYILMKSLKLTNTIGALIFPGMLSVFNVLIMKNYFEGLPESIEEAGKIDGASDIQVLFKIILPMSLPVIATIGIFYTVGYWNNFMNSVLYITKPALKPLQAYLYDILTEANSIASGLNNVDMERAMKLSNDALISTTIVVSTLPILCIYPFVQKYFVQGITIGSVKG